MTDPKSLAARLRALAVDLEFPEMADDLADKIEAVERELEATRLSLLRGRGGPRVVGREE